MRKIPEALYFLKCTEYSLGFAGIQGMCTFLTRRDPPGYSIFRVPLFHSDRGRYFLFAEWIRKVVENGLLKFVWGGWQAD